MFSDIMFGEMKTIMPEDGLSLFQIGSGVCQALAGYDIYDLKHLDENGRHPSGYTPAVINIKNGAFFYKLCQNNWYMIADYYSLTK